MYPSTPRSRRTAAFSAGFTSVVLSVIACWMASTTAAGAWPQVWRSGELRRHPLVGTIYDTRKSRVVSIDEYRAALATARFVLLGEVHDNPDHHLLQAMAVRAVPDPLAVVFEHFTAPQQTGIDAYIKALPSSDGASDSMPDNALGGDAVGGLLAATEWAKSGWPDGRIYRPLFDVVLARRVPIVAGNPPRDRVRTLARGSDEALSPADRRTYLLDQPLGARLDDALLTELEASHCNLMPKSALGGMALAQRYRDAHMAATLVRARPRNGTAILVAGNGHVRSDRGVPWYLARMAPGAAVISVGHIEVRHTSLTPAEYFADPPEMTYAIFTPRKRRPDPCAEMRKRFGKPKQQ